MISIYTISCPITEDVIYVGQTDNFTRRIKHHMSYFDDSKKSKYLKWLIDNGNNPIFDHVDIADNKKEALKKESDLIRECIFNGLELLNTNYQKLYYKYSMSGKFIGEVRTIRGDGFQIKMDRYTYKGFVYNTEKVFPQWKVDAYRKGRSVLKKRVYQFTKSGEFVSEFDGVRDACRITKIDHRSISQVAAGSKVRKSAGGFVWSYKK